MFWLVEHFFSIQGEGRYAGVPSYFLRTGGCNMSCPGFGTQYAAAQNSRIGCDTWFAADRFFVSKWKKIDDAEEVTDFLEKAFQDIGYTPHMIITGGEPLLYYADPEFIKIVEFIIKKQIHLTFETNGSVVIDFEKYPLYGKCTYALSVKLSNSMEPEKKRIVPEALTAIAENSREYFFKFAIDEQSIEGNIEQEIESIREYIPDAEVYCMPVGHDRESLEKNDKAVFGFCMKHNYIYSDRLHIRVFDTSEGV